MIGDYVDFDPRQYDEFRSRFTRVHEWHRKQELPQYNALLQKAAGRVENGLTEADVRWAMATIRERYHVLATRFATEAAPMLLAMGPEDLAKVEKGMADKRAKFEKDFVSGNRNRMLRKQSDRMEDAFEEWMGDLSAEQEKRIERFVAAHADWNAVRLADRKRRQQEMLAAVRRERDPAALAAALAELFAHPEKGRPAALEQRFARYDEDLVKLIVEMDRDAAAEQRVRTVKRMRKYAGDFAALSGAGVAVADSRQ